MFSRHSKISSNELFTLRSSSIWNDYADSTQPLMNITQFILVVIIIIIIIIIYHIISYHRFPFPWYFLAPKVQSPYTCDIPSRAIFCTKPTECSPGIVSRHFPVLQLQLQWPQRLLVSQSIPYSTFVEILYLSGQFIFSYRFTLLLYYIPVRWYCYIYQ
jgi:hypothetical protein